MFITVSFRLDCGLVFMYCKSYSPSPSQVPLSHTTTSNATSSVQGCPSCNCDGKTRGLYCESICGFHVSHPRIANVTCLQCGCNDECKKSGGHNPKRCARECRYNKACLMEGCPHKHDTPDGRVKKSDRTGLNIDKSDKPCRYQFRVVPSLAGSVLLKRYDILFPDTYKFKDGSKCEKWSCQFGDNCRFRHTRTSDELEAFNAFAGEFEKRQSLYCDGPYGVDYTITDYLSDIVESQS